MGAWRGHLTSWGHKWGGHRQKAKNELGLAKARRTEAGMRLQRGIQRKCCGKDGQEGLKCHSKKPGVDLEDPGEPWKILELGHEHHF